MRLAFEHWRDDQSQIVFGIFPLFPFVGKGASSLHIAIEKDAMADVNCSHRPLSKEVLVASLIGVIIRRQAHLRINIAYVQAPNLLEVEVEQFSKLAYVLMSQFPRRLVQAAYMGMLRRQPDPGGMDSALGLMEKHGFCMGMQKLIENMVNSKEFRQKRA